jgi:hypothetical protein
MEERDMAEERQNGKRKGWGIETKMLLFLELLPLCLGKTISRKLVGKINHSLVIKFLFFGQRLLR